MGIKNFDQLSREKIIFGAFGISHSEVLDTEKCKRIKDSGLDFIYVTFSEGHSNTQALLDSCKRNELLLFSIDTHVLTMPADRYYTMGSVTAPYMEHPALLGTVLRDEPGALDFPRLRLLQDAFHKIAPRKLAGVNLFPCYASSEQLGCDSYEEYIKRFMSEVSPPFLSYDFYPLYGTADAGTWIQDNYLRNFEIAAIAAKKANVPLWYFIQVIAFNYICRDPNESDIRWQVYISLSFGVTVIQLFTYGTLEDSGGEVFETAMIDKNSEKTPRYEAMQKVIKEVDTFGGNLLKYQWQGCMVKNRPDVPVFADKTVDVIFPGFVHTVTLKGNYLELDHELDGFDPILSVESTEPVLVGCFESKGIAGKAFTLVNMSDPGKKNSCCGRIVFNRKVSLRVCINGETHVLNGVTKLEGELLPGQGIFVEIEQDA